MGDSPTKLMTPFKVKALHMVVDDVQKDLKKDIILLGDFNRSMEIHPDSELGKKNYTALFKDTEYTNMAKTNCYDNIIIPRSCRERYCEDHEVTFPNTEIQAVKIQNGKIQIIDKKFFNHGLIFASFRID